MAEMRQARSSESKPNLMFRACYCGRIMLTDPSGYCSENCRKAGLNRWSLWGIDDYTNVPVDKQLEQYTPEEIETHRMKSKPHGGYSYI